MKKILIGLVAIVGMVIGLASCKTVVYNRAGGNDDLAYLQFVSSSSMSGKSVEVIVDNSATFEAKVQKERKSSIKPRQYTIKPGTRNIKVFYEQKLLIEQDIYVSQQKTKIIRL